jgi:hypothetical protein
VALGEKSGCWSPIDFPAGESAAATTAAASHFATLFCYAIFATLFLLHFMESILCILLPRLLLLFCRCYSHRQQSCG